jgi:hypothetical protein
MESCIGERWYLMPPRIPALWEAMAEDDQGPLALLGKVHLNAVGVDESVFYCGHRVSLEACRCGSSSSGKSFTVIIPGEADIFSDEAIDKPKRAIFQPFNSYFLF